MKKVLLTFTLTLLFTATQAQLALDFSQIGLRSGWQTAPVMEGHVSVSLLQLGLRAQLADAWISPLIGVDLGKPFRWEGPGGWTWSPIAHGYWAVTQGPGYRLGIEAQVAHWDDNGVFIWNGVDVSLTWGSDPILGQTVGLTAGININSRINLAREAVGNQILNQVWNTLMLKAVSN